MKYHAALAHFPKITYARYRKLAAYFSELKDLWSAEIFDLIKAGLEENIALEFLVWREQNSVEEIMDRLDKEKILTVSVNEPRYPKMLKEINDPPHTLFIRGNLPDDAMPAIAVVGTRKLTSYGKYACQDIAGSLAKEGVVIVSGLALGIDGIAHTSALDNNAKTIAVLGSGVDRASLYPAAHRDLAELIIRKGGAVLSEYPPGFLPTQYSFPQRNRIIAGLSHGVLVIEAPEQSGALITAKFALEYNREIFAVPHAINSPTGAGPNNLIKMGAKLATNASDIIDALNITSLNRSVSVKKIEPSNQTEAIILEIVSKNPTHIDQIIKASGLESHTVSSVLTLMEMKGKLKNMGGMTYILG